MIKMSMNYKEWIEIDVDSILMAAEWIDYNISKLTNGFFIIQKFEFKHMVNYFAKESTKKPKTKRNNSPPSCATFASK